MTKRIPSGTFLVVVLAACLIAGIPLYLQATEPLFHGGPPAAPIDDPASAAAFMRPGAAMTAVTAAAPPFVDVAEAAGIRYAWSIPGKRPLNILQTIGNGCAFLDYDNDGNLDILLVGPKLALYKGDGKGHFMDVSSETGLDKLSGHFLGCAVGDFDSDGFDDLYITAYRGGLLLQNEGRHGDKETGRQGERAQGLTPNAQRVFRDVTQEAGIKPQPWGTSAAFVETQPGSGRLDLFICNYVDFGPDSPQLCNQAHVLTACGPTTYRPLRGVLYANDGRGHFIDSTQALGVATSGNALGIAAADYDGSGRPSLAIANDLTPGDLLHPARGAGYTNVGVSSGTAYDVNGGLHNGMGVDWGDYDNDGKIDLFVTAFSSQVKSLYHNEGRGGFRDRAGATRIQLAAMPYVAFGCKLFDYDNDGWLDLMIVNGHVRDNAEEISKATPYRQPTQLFHNAMARQQAFEDVSKSSPDLTRPIVGRGLAVGDYDNDGRVDALVVDAEGKPLLLHNQARPAGHWLGVKLIGTKSNADGYGAVLTLKTGTGRLVRQCQACGSYLSSSDRRVHFGLGDAARADSLTIRWPSGRTESYRDLPANRYITIREGDARP